MQFRFRKGLDIDIGPRPDGRVAIPRAVSSVALLGADYPGVSFDIAVGEGEDVRAGQLLCTDRHRPQICFVAPVAGRVSRITLGPRRSLTTLEIEVSQSGSALEFDLSQIAEDDAALRHLLQRSGAWAGLIQRPYGHIPGPQAKPAAIFVTAMDTNPLAADPAPLLAPQKALMEIALAALARLTEGSVYLCQRPGAAHAEPTGKVKVATFSGPHPAGLPGTHIHHLMPASPTRPVWQLGWQDALAIGHLLSTGQIIGTRSLSLAGPGLPGPQLITAPLGARLADLLGEVPEGKAPRLISGSVLNGRAQPYLGRHATQVTALAATPAAPARPLWQRLLARLPQAHTGATEPREAFERALPMGLLPVPLMRALAVGDVETAARLGCCELLEEDMALLSWLCPSGSDYGALLRRSLDLLHAEAPA